MRCRNRNNELRYYSLETDQPAPVNLIFHRMFQSVIACGEVALTIHNHIFPHYNLRIKLHSIPMARYLAHIIDDQSNLIW